MGAVTLARVRQQASVGVLADAFGDEALLPQLRAGDRARRRNGHRARRAALRADPRLSRSSPARTSRRCRSAFRTAHSSNSIVTIGDRLFLKGYRRVRRGINPEVEIGRYLTDVAHFPNCVPLAGVVEHVDATDGAVMTLALLQAYVRNQGDGWTYTLEYLARFLDTQRAVVEVAAGRARRLSRAHPHAGRAHRRAARGPRTRDDRSGVRAGTGDGTGLCPLDTTRARRRGRLARSARATPRQLSAASRPRARERCLPRATR